MPAPTRPTNFPKPFAVSGTRNTIPDAPTGTNHASFTEGFPAVTMQPITSGGVPPSGDDFNGLFYDLMTHTVWVNAGGQYQFDAALSTAMGGYPHGFVLQDNAGTASYISLVDNNTTDFNSTPASIGSLWGAYAGAAFSSVSVSVTGGATTLTAAQLAADIIVISGSLTSNVTVNFPSVIGKYFVANNTTGAFLVNAIASGSAVQIKQGYGDLIFCDGVNMKYQQSSGDTKPALDVSRSLATTYYADRASSRVGGCSIDTGSADAYVIATIPPTSGYVDLQTVRFVPGADNLTTAPTLNAGAGAKALIRGDGTGPRPHDITGQSVITATYRSSIDKWIINGLLVPDISIQQWHYIAVTSTLQVGSYDVDTLAGPFGCNLPASAVLGDTIVISDIRGNFGISNFTLIATGGKQIVTKLGNITSLTCDSKGIEFKVWYDGSNWRLF